jgi:hypothetical protein
MYHILEGYSFHYHYLIYMDDHDEGTEEAPAI